MSAIVIVGVVGTYGQGRDLEDFARALYSGAPDVTQEASSAVHPQRTPEAVAADLMRNVRGETGPACIGVVVCAESASQETAERVLRTVAAGDRVCTGTPLVLGLEPSAVGRALAVAQQWLIDETVDLALVLAQDDLGVGGLLLALPGAMRSGTVYARLESVAWREAESGADLCRAALADADLTPADVELLETATWPPAPEVVAGYATPKPDLTCALGSPASVFQAVSPMGALVKAILALHRRTFYPSPCRSTGESPTCLPDTTPFYVVPEARPWFARQGGRRRYAAVVHTANDEAVHILLSEPAPGRDAVVVRPHVSPAACVLFPIVGANRDEVLSRLAEVRHQVETGADLFATARAAYDAATAHPDAAYALALVGHTRDELLKEMAFAEGGVQKAFSRAAKGRGEWQTPRGSVFTATPLGGDGVAFVYPGAFNAYVGLGRDLFQHFPALHDRFTDFTCDLGGRLRERWLYPRSRAGASNDAETWEAQLRNAPVALIESGAMVAVIHTLLVRDIFGVHPHAALGYSLGEMSMLWANGVWHEVDAGSRAFSESPLFHTRVVGPKEAVRESWGLAPGEALTWTTVLLKARVDDVRAAVDREPRVYMTLINLPDEVVIAGDAAGCRRVTEALDCHALEIPYGVAIHNAAVRSEYDALTEVYSHPVAGRPDMSFYSAAQYAPLVLERDALAHAMAEMSCQMVDFPRLVKAVYAGGARVFVELGPLATCTRRIKRILKGEPHAAVALNPSPGGDYDGVIGALAQLVTHRVPVNLAPLYKEAMGAAEVVVRGRKGIAAADAKPSDAVAPTVAVPEVEPIVPPVELPLSEPVGATLDATEAPPPHPVQEVLEPAAMQRVGVLDLGVYLPPGGGRGAHVHAAFLDARAAAQQGARSVIEMQVVAGRRVLGIGGASVVPGEGRWTTGARSRAGIGFGEADLREFAEGDVARCFGPDYEVFRGRRLPRIPNGDLLLMSRVTRIDGQPGVFTGTSSLQSVYDVPRHAWFDVGGEGLPPHVVLMELALQPCGFLSAYLQSPMLRPEADLYFRNLDGHAQVLADLDLRGKTVINDVQMVSSTQGQGVILQSFTYALSCEGTRFYEGWASFGYFPREALLRQAGLDGKASAPVVPLSMTAGAAPDPAAAAAPAATVVPAMEPLPHQLQLMHSLLALPEGGRYGLGYLWADGQITPWDWFFRAHFKGDPVMPGSLGVEAAAGAMRAYARWRYQAATGASAKHGAAAGHAVRSQQAWKYRGQITPKDRIWSLDVHLSEVREDATGLVLVGDANVWKEAEKNLRTRIYEIKGLTVRLGGAAKVQ